MNHLYIHVVFPCRQAAEEGHGDGQAAPQQDPEDQPAQPRLCVAPGGPGPGARPSVCEGVDGVNERDGVAPKQTGPGSRFVRFGTPESYVVQWKRNLKEHKERQKN